MVGCDLGLLEQGGHQAVGNTPVCGAFSNRVDTGVGHRLQRVVHHNAPVAVQPHRLGQRRVGADTHRHHHQVGGLLGAVLEPDGLDAAALAVGAVTHQFLGVSPKAERQAACLQRLAQQAASHIVELAVHQPGVHVHHRHLHAAQHQAVGGLQAQQAAANHHRVLVCLGGFDHGLGVGNVAVGDHTFQVIARHRQHEGFGAGAQQQAVVCGLGHAAVGGDCAHHAFHAVHLGHGGACVQGDVVVGVPLPRVEDDLVHRLLTRQHRRQHDAVVVGVGLCAKHGDVVQVGRNLQQLFQRAHPGHAVANHHQF